jgi:FkbM family methyltransferase
MMKLLKMVFELKKGAFLDVGVNLGQTLIMAKSVDQDRFYVGFEPNTSCCFYVEELIRINKFKHALLFPVGLFNKDSIMQLDLYDDDITNSGGSVIKDYWTWKKWTVKRSMQVPLFTVKTIRNSIDIPQFEVIKIDVEGAELEVLASLQSEIELNKPIIIIEILSAYSKENEIRYNRQLQIKNFIDKIDYRIIRIITNQKEDLVGLQKIDDFDVNANPNHSNYILFHSKYEQVIDEKFEKILIST